MVSHMPDRPSWSILAVGGTDVLLGEKTAHHPQAEQETAVQVQEDPGQSPVAGRKDLMQGEASVGSQPEDMHGERTSWPALSPLGGGGAEVE